VRTSSRTWPTWPRNAAAGFKTASRAIVRSRSAAGAPAVGGWSTIWTGRTKPLASSTRRTRSPWAGGDAGLSAQREYCANPLRQRGGCLSDWHRRSCPRGARQCGPRGRRCWWSQVCLLVDRLLAGTSSRVHTFRPRCWAAPRRPGGRAGTSTSRISNWAQVWARPDHDAMCSMHVVRTQTRSFSPKARSVCDSSAKLVGRYPERRLDEDDGN
jgi:hypothetical protein